MEDKTKDKIKLASFTTCCVILFGYIFLRAYRVGFTHDESLTFTIINGDSFWMLTANNHWLNTVLSYISAQIFGFSELALRLPNILIFFLYGYFSYLLVVKRATTILSAIIPLVFLLFNPYLIEFFSLSRGYGLAITFFTGSLYFFVESHKNIENYKTLYFAVICSLLTIYSNYSFLTPVAAIHLSFFICVYKNIRWEFFTKGRLIIFAAEGILLLPAAANIIILVLRKQLYYGGTNGFVQDTLFSLFTVTFQTRYLHNQNLIILFVFATAMIFGIVYRKRKELLFINLVIAISILFPVFFNFLFDMKFPVGRTGLYWIVLIGVFIHLFIEKSLPEQKSVSILFNTIFACIGFWVIVSFYHAVNLEFARSWKGDADIKAVLEILRKEVKTDIKCNLRADRYYEPAINYYRISQNYNWLNPVTNKVRNDIRYDYLYTLTNRNIQMDNKKVISNFTTSNSKLIKISRKNGCCPNE